MRQLLRIMRPMAQPKKTLYQILGVPRDASEEAIGLAHEMKSAEMQHAVPPNPSGLAMVNQAREILSDPKRRAAYDASLVAAAEKAAAHQQSLEQEPDADAEADADEQDRKRKMRLGAMIGGVALVMVILFFAIRPKSPPPPPAPEPSAEAPKPAPPPPPKVRTAADIVADASTSGGQLLSYSMSGSGAPAGMALEVELGQMITTCHGIPAGAKLVVKVGPQLHAADLTITDEELDLCRLSVAGFATPPLKVATEEAKAGDRVFVVSANAKGEIAATEGKINQVRTTPRGRVLELSVPIAATASGGGVFNEFGQLVGIATAPHDYGAGLNVALPVSWIAQMRSRATPPK